MDVEKVKDIIAGLGSYSPNWTITCPSGNCVVVGQNEFKEIAKYISKLELAVVHFAFETMKVKS